MLAPGAAGAVHWPAQLVIEAAGGVLWPAQKLLKQLVLCTALHS